MIPVFSAAVAESTLDLAAPVTRVLQRHQYVLGEEVAAFEQEFAAYLGTGHCVGVANGTDALELALRAVGAATGDRIVTAANAGFFSSTAIYAVGAVPLYVDVSQTTLTLCPDRVAAILSSRPKAVIATHLYGGMADVARLVTMCDEAGVVLIEDCAQAHGAALNGRRAGSFGHLACFSFYPTKNLGAVGDGGAVVTRDAALAARLRKFRQYGWKQKYDVVERGGRNSRLDELQAAVLRDKLGHLDAWNAARRAIAGRYNAAFAELPLTLPDRPGDDHVFHLYVVRSPLREALRRFLADGGIGTALHYPIPDHLQRAYPDAALGGPLPVTEQACKECLTLPCFPGLTDDEVARVIDTVRAFFRERVPG